MKLHVHVHRAHSGPDGVRVIRPARPLDRARLVDVDHYFGIHADRAAAMRIAGLLLLAARSRRSLVHLPLRHGRLPDDRSREQPALDLVLLHHSLQFPPSRWKRVRAALPPGTPHTAHLPETTHLPTDKPASLPEHRLHEHVHAETAFFTGSETVFRDMATCFLDVARNTVRADSAHYRLFGSTLWANDFPGTGRSFYLEHEDRWH